MSSRHCLGKATNKVDIIKKENRSREREINLLDKTVRIIQLQGVRIVIDVNIKYKR